MAQKWEFDAPKCVDFQNREHEQEDDAEDYFNYHTEEDEFLFQNEIPEEFGGSSVKMASGSINSATKPPISKFDEPTHVSKAVGVVKPMQNVFGNQNPTMSQQGNVISNNSADLNISGVVMIPCSPADEPSANDDDTKEKQKCVTADQKPSIVAAKKLPNLMTPSRLASWNSGKATFAGKENSGKKTIKAAVKSSSATKQPLRRSLRQNRTPHTTNPEPASKKAKSNSTKPIPKHQRANSVDVTKLLKFPAANKGATHKRALTSEERELQKIEQLRKEAAQTKKENEKFLKKSQKPQKPTANTHNAKTHCTKPKEFHFKTDERIAKSHSMALRSDTSSSKDFTSDLRKHNPSPYKPKKTVPEPFHFNDKKRKKADENHPPAFVPMAKAIIDFHKATPRRFRHTQKTGVSNNGPMKATALHITEPKTPNFSSKPRNKPISTMSAKEKEDLEVEEMKKYKFKANPVNKACLDGKEKLKVVESKPATVPVGFNLSEPHKPHKSSDDELKPEAFKAQPVPTAILEKVCGVKEKAHLKPTIPKSPAFALKERAKIYAEKAHEAEVLKQEIKNSSLLSKTVCKSNELGTKVYGIPIQPQVEKKGPTKAQPFSFDKADKQRFHKKEEKIKEILKEEQKPIAFKARPMPIPATPTLPPKAVKGATKAKPFNLQIEQRVGHRVEEFNKQMEEEVKQLREQTLFKANQSYEKVLKGKPFEPKKTARSVETQEFTLHSTERAKQREIIAHQREEEAKRKEALIEERKRVEEEEQEKEIAELRKQLVHKAQGIHKYKPVPEPQGKELTNPCSPNFSDRFKK